MSDSMLHEAYLKNGRLIRTAIRTELFGEFLSIVHLNPFNRIWKSLDQMFQEQGQRNKNYVPQMLQQNATGNTHQSQYIGRNAVRWLYSQGRQKAQTSHQSGYADRDTASAHIHNELDFILCMLVGMMMRSAGTVMQRLNRAIITTFPTVNVLAVGFILNSRLCNTKLIGILNER